MPEHLLVLGATGGCGRHVVAGALARGYAVVALARPAALAAGPLPAGATVIVGDVLAPGAVAAALAAHRVAAVISCVGIRRRRAWNPWSALCSPPDLVARVARAVVDAARAHGVARILAISAAGVADSAPSLNAVMRFLVARSQVGVAYRDLAAAERVLATSGLDWTAVRPVTLRGGRAGRARAVARFGTFATIARATVAEWLLDHVGATPAGAPRTPMIAG